MKTAFMFAGQGAQYINMGKELYDAHKSVRVWFERASDVLGYSLTDICFTENEKLNRTEFTQAAILVLSYSIYDLIKDIVEPSYLLGLSLGEYTALLGAEAIDFDSCVDLIKFRGELMENAVPSGVGAMTAIMGLTKEQVNVCCEEAYGIVMIANINTSLQIVVAGEKEAVLELGEIAIRNGAKRIIPLNVSGPFHTTMLKEASVKLEQKLKTISFNELQKPVISNYTANPYRSKEDIVPYLTQQIMSTVKWEESILNLISNGCDTFIELGPSRTLSSFVKRIDRNVKILNVEDIKSYDKMINFMKG